MGSHKNFFFWGIIFNIALFLILLAQNPFSNRHILSDLYLYPDTIHYINPAVNILQGSGLRITREGRSIATEVPPLYSLVLAPVYLISHDPRMFYFTNVALALTSAWLFFLVLKQFSNNKLIIFFVFFLYVTNFFIDWYPKLAMAENLALLLFLAGLYLLLSPPGRCELGGSLASPPRCVLAGIVGVSLVATKYALAPVSISFFILYAIKIFLAKGSHKIAVKTKIGWFLIFFISGLTAFSLFIYSENLYKGYNLFAKSQYLLKPLTSTIVSGANVTAAVSLSKPQTIFSFSNLHDSFVQYLAGLMGGPLEFAGFYKQPVPVFVGMLGLPAIGFGLLAGKRRFASLCLAVLLVSSIVFMSTFKVVDGRYIYHTIPILLLGFTVFLEETRQVLVKNRLQMVWHKFCTSRHSERGRRPSVGILTNIDCHVARRLAPRNDNYGIYIWSVLTWSLFIYYLLTSADRLGTQVFENWNGDRTPINYNTVVELNRFFQKNPPDTKKPLVITDLMPYFVDLYGSGRYRVLPLANFAFFGNQAAAAWGPQDDYHDLFSVYDSYLKKGFEVYVSNATVHDWNKKYLLRNFNQLKEKYNLTRVSIGCSGVCILYKLQPKNFKFQSPNYK